MSKKTQTPSTDVKSSGWGFLLALILFLALSSNLIAGVLVAPTVIFINDKNRTARMDVQNPTNEPREVTIHLSYGLPISDSLGNVTVSLQDSNVTDPRSAMDWIKVFPRKMIIPPNQTQVVRFVANPPAGLTTGEYWSRIVVRSQEGQTTLPSGSDSTSISTKLNMIMQTAIMLKYRQGDVATALEMTNAHAAKNDSQVVVMLDLKNTGTASYVGNLTCRLLDADKKQVAVATSDLAVYRDLRRRMEIPVKNVVAKGPLSVEILVSSDGRTDIAPADMIKGNKIQELVSVD